jgi:hypothetical protein
VNRNVGPDWLLESGRGCSTALSRVISMALVLEVASRNDVHDGFVWEALGINSVNCADSLKRQGRAERVREDCTCLNPSLVNGRFEAVPQDRATQTGQAPHHWVPENLVPTSFDGALTRATPVQCCCEGTSGTSQWWSMPSLTSPYAGTFSTQAK